MAATAEKPGVVFTEDEAIHTLGNGNVVHYRKVNGIFYHAATPAAVVRALENARSCPRRRVRLYYGDVASGIDWLDEVGMEGSIGNSMGPLRIPILLSNRRSHGGPGLLDHCIVKVKWTTGGILYDPRDRPRRNVCRKQLASQGLPAEQWREALDHHGSRPVEHLSPASIRILTGAR